MFWTTQIIIFIRRKKTNHIVKLIKKLDECVCVCVFRVLRLDGFSSELVGEVAVQVPDVPGVNVSLMIPCGFFSRGGTYSLQLQHKSDPVPDRFADLHNAQVSLFLLIFYVVVSRAAN